MSNNNCLFSHRMAIPIAILDCDLLLHGRGHKTLDRFDLEAVSDSFLLSQFGFPREFILYLIELLREVRLHLIKHFPPPARSNTSMHDDFLYFRLSVDARSDLEPSAQRCRCWLLWGSTHQALSRPLWVLL